MRNSISLMIIASLFVLSAVAMALTVFINLHKFDKAFEAAVNDRFYFVLENVGDALEAEMRLGLPLENLSTAQAALDDAEKRDSSILSVEVFDPEGRTLYSTDRSYLFDIVPATWEHAWEEAQNADGRWNIKERDAVALGVGLTDMLGNPAGSVVMRYSTSLFEDTLASLQSVMIKRAVGLCIGANVIMFILVSFLTRPLKDYFRFLEGEAVALAGGKASHEQVVVDGIEDSHIHEFVTAYEDAEKRLGTLEAELRRMDEEA